MTATVRRATPDDADQIAEIIGEIILEDNPVGFDREWSDEEVVAWMERQGDQGTMLVIDDGRHVLGFAAIDFDSATPDECSFGSWIRERNRRQGYGTALANEALAFARDKGYKRIRARLPRDNEPALSYLSSIGAMVPLRSPGTRFELPVYQEGDA
jgi:RimJ/RimL family protein N-acetyltransferase